MEVYQPQIFATDPIYSGVPGKSQFIEYWSVLQKWNGSSAWLDLYAQVGRGVTDTHGSTFIVGIRDTYPISDPGFYRIQYHINWWNGYVDRLGKQGVTAVIASRRYNIPTARYRTVSPDVIELGTNPMTFGVPTNKPYCEYKDA